MGFGPEPPHWDATVQTAAAPAQIYVGFKSCRSTTVYKIWSWLI